MPDSKILVVDDDAGHRNAIQFILQKEKYNVITAANGREGLELLNAQKDIKIAIIDLAMLDVSGVELLTTIKDREIPLQRIVLTAHEEELTFKRAEELKVFCYLNKPVKKHSLLFSIKLALNDLRAKELEKIIKSIERLNDPILRKNLEKDEVIDLILQETLKWTEAKNGSVLIHDEVTDNLKILASRKDGAIIRRNIGKTISIDTPVWGQVFKNGSPVIMPGMDEKSTESLVSNDLKSIVAIPLSVSGRCIGIISIESAEQNYFMNMDLTLLSILATEASVIIENAILKDELIKKESFSKLGEVSLHITHGIGSMLGLINGQAQLLKEKLEQVTGELPPDYIENIDHIIQQSRLASRIKNRILKCYSDKIEQHEIDFRELINSVIMEKRAGYLPDNIKIVEKLPEEALNVVVDYDLVKLALEELINNSIQSMKDGGSITIMANLSKDRRRITAEIKDTGIGIEEKDINKIFAPFFTRFHDEGGTGIGLWSAREIIVRFGGNVILKETKVEQGSTFVIILPVAKS